MQEGMYAISEMASLFNVSRQTLIYYDKIGLFKPAVVNDRGYRFYSPTQIPFMRLICMLRDLGLELDEIDRLVSTFDIGEMTDRLRARVDVLDENIAELKAERESVCERLRFYEEAVLWRGREGKPTLRHFDRRFVIFEAFPMDVERDRSMLHPTLMRAIDRMHRPIPSPALDRLPCCPKVPRACCPRTPTNSRRWASRSFTRESICA